MSVVHQGRGAEASWKCDWGRQPAERVLQDIKAWRGLEQRLREIQQQLDVLGQSQEMTVSSETTLVDVQRKNLSHTENLRSPPRSLCIP